MMFDEIPYTILEIEKLENLSHTYTYFPKIVNLYSYHPKYIKERKKDAKFQDSNYFLTYMEEKNKIENPKIKYTKKRETARLLSDDYNT